MTQNHGQNMLLHTSYWADRDTFKLMPLTMDCPFVEAIYDPASTLLVVISKTSKENFQWVPRVDEDGNTIKSKGPKTNGKPYKEQRVSMQILQEYYLVNKEEQEAFIKRFAVNAEEYDYKKYLRDLDAESTIHKVETPVLVDAKGNNLPKSN